MWTLIKIVIPKIKARWEDVAYCMGYDIYFVEATKKQFINLDEQCKKVFTDWLTTSHGPTPKTWQILLSKLNDVEDLKAAVESIEKELIEQHELDQVTSNTYISNSLFTPKIQLLFLVLAFMVALAIRSYIL